MTSTSRTARCGPACRVVWEGTGQVSWPPLSRLQPRCAALLGYFFAGVSSGMTNPIGRFFGSGGASSWRIESISPVIA